MPTRVLVVTGVLVALLLAGVVSYYASRAPDGLDRVAHDKGFAKAEPLRATVDSPMAGYSVRGVDDGRLSGGAAGVAGVLIVLVLAGGLALVVRRRSGPETQDQDSDQGVG